jgi:hypothetical protein
VVPLPVSPHTISHRKSSSQDEQSMRTTTDTARALRDRFIAETGPSNTIVDECEIALMRRNHRFVNGGPNLALAHFP